MRVCVCMCVCTITNAAVGGVTVCGDCGGGGKSADRNVDIGADPSFSS